MPIGCAKLTAGVSAESSNPVTRNFFICPSPLSARPQSISSWPRPRAASLAAFGRRANGLFVRHERIAAARQVPAPATNPALARYAGEGAGHAIQRDPDPAAAGADRGCPDPGPAAAAELSHRPLPDPDRAGRPFPAPFHHAAKLKGE